MLPFYAHTHTHTPLPTCTYIYTLVHKHVCVYTYTTLHMHVHTFSYPYTLHKYICTHVCKHTHAHTHILIPPSWGKGLSWSHYFFFSTFPQNVFGLWQMQIPDSRTIQKGWVSWWCSHRIHAVVGILLLFQSRKNFVLFCQGDVSPSQLEIYFTYFC